MGAGVPMQDGDIAFKSNFATWDPATGIVARRRADRRFEDVGPVLCQHLDGACCCRGVGRHWDAQALRQAAVLQAWRCRDTRSTC